MKQSAWGLIIAMGKSEKIASDVETAFLYLNDRPVLAYSLAAFNQCPEIDGIVVVVSRERAESVLGMVQLFGFAKVRKIVAGGATRAAAMAAGLQHVDDSVEWVCVHDASRPMVKADLIAETVKTARRHGSGIAATEIPDAVVAAKKSAVHARFDQDERLWAAISPQTWPLPALLKAYPKSGKARKNYADDLEAMLTQKITPRLVPTTACSLRIRTAADIAPAIALMK